MILSVTVSSSHTGSIFVSYTGGIVGSRKAIFFIFLSLISANSVKTQLTSLGISVKIPRLRRNMKIRKFNEIKPYDTGLLHHFHFTLQGLYCEDISWILLFTHQHGLTRFTCFHGTHRKFYFVSDVLTLYAHWLVPTSKVIMLYIWLPKTEFMSLCFCLNFFICGCE